MTRRYQSRSVALEREEKTRELIEAVKQQFQSLVLATSEAGMAAAASAEAGGSNGPKLDFGSDDDDDL